MTFLTRAQSEVFETILRASSQIEKETSGKLRLVHGLSMINALNPMSRTEQRPIADFEFSTFGVYPVYLKWNTTVIRCDDKPEFENALIRMFEDARIGEILKSITEAKQ